MKKVILMQHSLPEYSAHATTMSWKVYRAMKQAKQASMQ